MPESKVPISLKQLVISGGKQRPLMRGSMPEQPEAYQQDAIRGHNPGPSAQLADSGNGVRPVRGSSPALTCHDLRPG